MSEQNEPGFSHLRITVPFKLKCRFGGIDYAWPKGGEALNVPIEAARHCFGFGLDDKAPSFHRLGWLTTSDTMETAQAKLDQIDFQPIRQVFEIQPRASRRGRAPKISNDRSLVNAGGTKGPSSENPDPVPDDPDDDDEDEDDIPAEAI